MRADEVPREDERKDWEDDDMPWRRSPSQRPRPRELISELLVARVLKKAKERFEVRQWEDEQPEEEAENIQSETDTVESPLTPKSKAPHTYTRGLDGMITPSPERALKPAMLTDDERATNLLQPSINHILTKFDYLLSGLHRARAAYATRKSKKPSTQRSSTRSKTRKRPRSPSPDSDSASNYSTTAPSSRRPSARRKSRPSSAMSVDPPSPPSPKLRSSSPPRRKARHTIYGLRDWSDVLGMASIMNWDPAIVRKAAERCASLFGEGMAFRTFDHDHGNTLTTITARGGEVVVEENTDKEEKGKGKG